MANPIRFRIQNTVPIQWNNGQLFNGYVVFTLTLPTGYAGKAKLTNALETDLNAPEVYQLWIRDGIYDANAAFWSNSSITPTNSYYTWNWYDAAGSHLTQFDDGSGSPVSISDVQTYAFTASADFTITENNYDLIGGILISPFLIPNPAAPLRLKPTTTFV